VLDHAQSDGGCELCLHATPLDHLVTAKPVLATPPAAVITPILTAASVPSQLDAAPFWARAPPSGLF
jgi:hypothetical protein